MYKIDNVEFSEETIKSALIKAGHKFEKPKKPKFEPRRVCCLRVSVEGQEAAAGQIVIRSNHSGNERNGHADMKQPDILVERYNIGTATNFIKAIRAAIDYYKANK